MPETAAVELATVQNFHELLNVSSSRPVLLANREVLHALHESVGGIAFPRVSRLYQHLIEVCEPGKECRLQLADLATKVFCPDAVQFPEPWMRESCEKAVIHYMVRIETTGLLSSKRQGNALSVWLTTAGTAEGAVNL